MAGPKDPNEIEEDVGETDEGADAGQVDYESGDAPEGGQEPEEFEAQERVDRRGRRDDATREELRALREHNQRVEAELQQIRQERQQRQQPQEETEDQFQARISLLEPDQRWEARFQRSEQRNARQTALAVFAAADRADKAAFDAKAQSDPVYKKHAQEVENVLMIERRRGKDFDRETVLDFVIGRGYRTNRGKPSAARQQAQNNLQRQQATTTGGRGDQAAPPRQRRYAPNDMSPEAVRQRLEQPDAYI